MEEVGDICKAHADAVMAAKGKKGGWEKPPTDEEMERLRNDVLFLRQYLCYLLNLQEDLSSSIERLQRDRKDRKSVV